MKAAFGLAGILVVLGVIVWLMGSRGGTLDQAKEAIDAKKKAETVLQPLSNRNADGGKISDTITLQPMTTSGGTTVSGLLVARIEPTNVLAARYGLKQNDLITKVSVFAVKDDPGLAEAMVLEAVGKNYPLTVTRGSQAGITLPQAASEATGQQTPQPRTPANGAENSLQRQLQGIQKTPTH